MTEPTHDSDRFLSSHDAEAVAIATMEDGKKYLGWVSEQRDDNEVPSLGDPLEITLQPMNGATATRTVGIYFYVPEIELPSGLAIHPLRLDYYPKGSKLYRLYFQARDTIAQQKVEIVPQLLQRRPTPQEQPIRRTS